MRVDLELTSTTRYSALVELDAYTLGVIYETADESGAGGVVFKRLEKPS